METNQQKEIPLFIFVAGVIGCVTLLGLILGLSEHHSNKTNTSQGEQITFQKKPEDKRNTYKLVGSPVIIVYGIEKSEAECLKGGGGLSCFSR